MSNQFIINVLFKDLFNHRKKAYWPITKEETFQKSGKHDPFKHRLNKSVIMKKISGSQFFNTTTLIPSGPDALD